MGCSACGGGSGSSSAAHFNLKGRFRKNKPQMLTRVVKLTPAQYYYYRKQQELQNAQRGQQRAKYRLRF